MKHSREGSKAGDGGVVPYERDVNEPAPVVDTKAGSAWRLETNRDQREDGSRQAVACDLPAPSVTGVQSQWKWTETHPATTVMGDTRVWPPGHHANANEPGRSRNEGAVPVTLEELAILQDFPPGYPFVGNRSSVSRQIGNAVPAKLAEACLRAVAS